MVLLGFIDEPKKTGTTGNDDDPSNWTISRIGGEPAYHNQELIAEKLQSSLICSKCQQTQIFVCQLYCPLTGHPYDRALYLFACRNPSCWNTSNSWTAVRCQKYDETVDKEEEIVKTESESSPVPLASTDWCNDADEWNTDDEDQQPTTTVKTQNGTTKRKSEPDRVLTEQLDSIQIDDDDEQSSSEDEVDVETNKKSTKKPVPVASADAFNEWKRKNLLEKPPSIDSHFPFYYIDIDDEQSILDEARLNEKKKWKNKHPNVDEDDDDDETGKAFSKEKYEKSPDIEHGDLIFYRFQQKIRYAPEQIIRYDKSGSPLILTKLDANALSNVQKCRHCQSICSFEFQLMPALVNFLKIDQQIALEYGTVFVYTCSANCWNDQSDLFRLENVFVQADPDQNLFD